MNCHEIEKSEIEPSEKTSLDQGYYANAKRYWASVPANNDGMLGGFSDVSFIDIEGSKNFLMQIFKTKPAPGRGRVADCGAGIGRISKNLLIQYFDKVDLVEQDETFCEKARLALQKTDKLGQIYNVGLQNFEPDNEKYDVIWNQWVLSHLKDDHLVYYLRKCSKGLKKNGCIVIKENFTSSEKVEFDPKDSSVTRPLSAMRQLISEAGLRVIRETRQTNFPKGLYPVHILALRPALSSAKV